MNSKMYMCAGDWAEAGDAWAEVHHDEPLSQDTLDEVRYAPLSLFIGISSACNVLGP